MRSATILAIVLAVVPTAAMARNPAAALAPPAQASGSGTGGGRNTADRYDLPVPGYKIIAGVLLAGVAGVIFAFTQQDDTPDSN